MPWWLVPTIGIIAIAVIVATVLWKYARAVFWIGAALAITILVYATAIEPFQLRTQRWTVSSAAWPMAQAPLKIAIIADPHAAWPWLTSSRLTEILDRAMDLQPDLIVHVGDFVATHPFQRKINPTDGVAPYARLRAPCGVFYILGNHDFDPSAPGWPQALKAINAQVLENEASPATCRGNSFWVAGLEDQWEQTPDLSGTLAQIPDNTPVILLMHEPDLFPEVPSHVALTLAGHTHGGQIVLPFLGPLAIPSKYGRRYAYGPVSEENGTIVISGGLGMSIVPMRFGRPPEITLVTLQSKPNEP